MASSLGWPVDRHLEPQVDEHPQGDVAHAQGLARQVGLRRQLRLGDRQQFGALPRRGLCRRRVALFRRQAHGVEEDGDERRGQGRGGPVHPAVGRRPHGRVRRPQAAGVVARGQIADDGVGFPQHQAVVLDHRHQAVGIARPVGRGVDHAEGHAGVDPLIGEVGLAATPQHLLDVVGVGPAPDPEHQSSSCRDASWRSRLQRQASVARGQAAISSAERRQPTHRPRRPMRHRSMQGEATGPGGRSDRGMENPGGAERNRTADLLIANEALYQLSYGPQEPRR